MQRAIDILSNELRRARQMEESLKLDLDTDVKQILIAEGREDLITE